MEIMLTLTVQKTIKVKDNSEYDNVVNTIVARLEEEFDSVDVTSEDDVDGYSEAYEDD